MTPPPSLENELYFERGGPAYRLMQRVGIVRGDDPSVRRRIVLFIAITWVPLLLLSVIDGHALGATPRQSFLLDFATYARFFVAVPLFFVAEVVVGPRLTAAARQFVEAGFVRPEEYPAFDRAIERAVRRRESVPAEIILLGLALAVAWTVSPETVYGGGSASWIVVSGEAGEAGAHFSLAGLWYKFVAVPILQFFWLRWLWRLVIWTRFLGAVSRLNLDLVPTHADQAGGLGFLGTAHMSLGIFAVATSSILSADAAFRIYFEDAPIANFQAVAIALVVATEVVCLGPMLVFAPLMARKRRDALRDYSLLVVRYNRAFHEKWVGGKAPDGEPLLGSADIQSLADLGASFEYIRSMKFVPFSLRVVVQLAVIAALPAVPLLPLVMPWQEILRVIAGALF
ncbi:MAG: hypothetical protein L0Y71_11580 [Gemmataceae bacterium]|nr:hypothetical protein [Gemmataceae bacterium]